MSSDGIDRRRHPRVKSNLEAHVTSPSQDINTQLCDVSEGGAFLAVQSGDDVPRPGTGLRVDFRLPIGFWVSASCVVRWARMETGSAGPRGCGVQFTSMTDANKKFLDDMLAAGDLEREQLDARFFNKFLIDVSSDGRVSFLLCGALSAIECESLRQELVERLDKCLAKKLSVFLNAHEFKASHAKSLEVLKDIFAQLKKSGLEVGVLVEPPSLAGGQLRRVIRHAGAADAFMSFASEEEASSFWNELTAGGLAGLE